jgi:DNA repair exonuclease SbcCD nuclease subunit
MKYAVISDIHLGHPNTPSEHIVKNLTKYLLSQANTSLDVIFIAGDLFDRLLDLNNTNVNPILDFIHKLLTYCSSSDIYLRILEGTPSHDWQQSKLLLKINELLDKPANVKYHCTLDIDYIDCIDKYVLYIPDEWSHDHTKIEEQIKEKLLQNNIIKVDIAILHGQFTYQLKTNQLSQFHYKEDYFLNITKGYIHIGHYHTYTTFDRIIANGSFERLAHGEEEDKGYVVVTDNSYTFITNKDAYRYITINVTAKTTIATLDAKIYKLPKYSYIRLLMDSDHPLTHQINELKVRYSEYNIKRTTKEAISDKNTITYILNDTPLQLSHGYINESNIKDILMAKVDEEFKDTQLNSIAKTYLIPLQEMQLNG